MIEKFDLSVELTAEQGIELYSFAYGVLVNAPQTHPFWLAMERIMVSIPIKKLMTEKQFIAFIQRLEAQIEFAKSHKDMKLGQKKFKQVIDDFEKNEHELQS